VKKRPRERNGRMLNNNPTRRARMENGRKWLRGKVELKYSEKKRNRVVYKKRKKEKKQKKRSVQSNKNKL
jgi:hypothetical protein